MKNLYLLLLDLSGIAVTSLCWTQEPLRKWIYYFGTPKEDLYTKPSGKQERHHFFFKK